MIFLPETSFISRYKGHPPIKDRMVLLWIQKKVWDGLGTVEFDDETKRFVLHLPVSDAMREEMQYVVGSSGPFAHEGVVEAYLVTKPDRKLRS